MKSRVGVVCSLLIGLFPLPGLVPGLGAAMSVTLHPSIPGQAATGTVVSWTAVANQAAKGTLWYRFRSRPLDQQFRVVRDYGPSNVLKWAAAEHEGLYEIEVSLRNIDTGESATTSAVYTVVSRVRSDSPIISETSNPLVFLYSAPPCPDGSRMKVQFQAVDGPIQSTPYKDCRLNLSMNFYLAGLPADTDYAVKNIIDTGDGLVDSVSLTMTTPDVSLPIAGYSVLQSPTGSPPEGILMQSTFTQMTVATDLAGNPVWFYSEPITYMTRPAPGGFFWLVIEAPNGDSSAQALRMIDLAGNPILETNAARVSEQLTAIGKRPISAFHHEASTLPDGNILALASTEQIFTDVQGPGDVDVLGDMILVLDSNLQVLWAWDAFDHLDPARAALLGEVCSAVSPGCPPYYLASRANDWLHGNSVQLTPDGNLIYSARHQDWLIKIDYQNGQGCGDIIWRLGQGGDFQINSSDPSPWFSHQHDAGFEQDDNGKLIVFDNGNLRNAADPTANSRGQVLQLDEANRVATLALNADLGTYSPALGTAQKLSSGNYHFNVGWTPDAGSVSVEVDPKGNIVYAVKIGTMEYRTFRMRDLYTP